MKTHVKTRNDFPALLCELGLTAHAAEIGVAEGYSSFHLLDHWPGTCYLIDPWEVLDVPGYSPHGDYDQEARFNRVAAKVNKTYKGRVLMKRATSAMAVGAFPDSFFDFVYLDAGHVFKSIQEDISLWWPKVRQGGILAGHDYLDGVIQGVDYGVKRAVDEFARKHGLPVLTTLEKDWPSWWIPKR